MGILDVGCEKRTNKGGQEGAHLEVAGGSKKRSGSFAESLGCNLLALRTGYIGLVRFVEQNSQQTVTAKQLSHCRKNS